MKQILCIEDQADIHLLLKLTLEASGKFKVHVAENGADGIAQAGSLGPDAVLLDFTLPDMDAPAVIDELKRQPATARIPVILLSATPRVEDIDDCKARGAVAALAKPFNPRTLAGELETILQGRAAGA
jgi:CheY-like chemotaxis protein